ncbi:MAG: Gfo/Idh/MocA family oxidoreductase [Bacteroidaceae bacterium]|nr:Gfo/Idh/MocA family oxidoreductase [Bacteroidaceae bacterium]
MKLSVIGTGKIVHEALPVIVGTRGIEVRSIVAREHSLEKAQTLARKYGIPQATASFDDALSDPSVDTVYIALINSVHFDYTLRALQAGKHVVLEKPACLCHSELKRLSDEARGRGLMLFEAVTLLHLPAFQLLKTELLPQLGTLRHIECNYSQRSSRLDAYLRGEVLPAFDPAAGGGALMDINIYNLHFVHTLLGRPLQSHYLCRRGFNGVDLSGTAVLEYDGLTALCTGAKDTDAPSYGLLQADNGWLRIDGPVSTMSAITLCLRGEQPREIPLAPVAHRLAPEFAAFADILQRRDYETMNRLLDHSLAVMQTVDLLNQRG